VHGINARNLSVQLSLSQTSKNASSFLLSLVLSSTKSENKGRTGSAQELGVKVAQIMHTHVRKCKNNKIKKL
jgi:hypothetical protein